MTTQTTAIEKLPRWARDLIAEQERTIATLKRQVEPESVHIGRGAPLWPITAKSLESIDGKMEDITRKIEARHGITFTFGPDSHIGVWIKDGAIQVHGSRAVAIELEAANSCAIRCRDW